MDSTFIRALFNAFIQGGGAVGPHTYVQLPDTAAGTTTTAGAGAAYGAYAQIVASSAADYWLVGVHMAVSTVGEAVQVNIATGAAASETVRVSIPYIREVITAVGEVIGVTYALPFPLRIPSATRIACRARSATNATINVHVILATGLVA